MKRLIALTFLMSLLTTVAHAQVRKHKKKNSIAAGTLFGYWGYNRSYYSNSTIRFIGQNYDFRLKEVAATDRPEKFRAGLHFNPLTITVPQYNMRLGYYFKDKWAISFGVDHLKYVMADQNNVLLNGFIGIGVDSTWSGIFTDEPVVTDRNKFHYENTNGLNFLRFELARSFPVYELGRQRQLALVANAGVSTGPMLTFNDFNFEGVYTASTPSLSGYGLGMNGALRFEFFRHFFMQMNVNLGVIHLTHVRTRPDDRNAFARQAFGYSEYNIAAGFLLYLRPKNGCDSCPNW